MQNRFAFLNNLPLIAPSFLNRTTEEGVVIEGTWDSLKQIFGEHAFDAENKKTRWV